jgi:HTH-type transcriptional regulator/antitoxin HigA
MNASADEMVDLVTLTVAWQEFDRLARLKPLDTEADYRNALALLDQIWEVATSEANHPLGSLLALLASQINTYENQHYPMGESEPHEILQFLMEQGKRTPDDLAEVVDRTTLLEILAGYREIDRDIAVRLAQYFNAAPQLFLKKRPLSGT